MGVDPFPPAIEIADSAGLDFLNSVAALASGSTDWLSDGGALMRWMGQFGLTDNIDLEGLRFSALPDELDAVAARARSLRDWFRAFVVEHAGRPLNGDLTAAMAPLNALLARDSAYQMVTGGKGRPALVWHHRLDRPDALLVPIAQMVATTIVEADFAQVKQCEGAGCTLWFEDRTRGHRRRWCSMALCGNRAKQAQHRARHREEAEG